MDRAFAFHLCLHAALKRKCILHICPNCHSIHCSQRKHVHASDVRGQFYTKNHERRKASEAGTLESVDPGKGLKKEDLPPKGSRVNEQ